MKVELELVKAYPYQLDGTYLVTAPTPKFPEWRAVFKAIGSITIDGERFSFDSIEIYATTKVTEDNARLGVVMFPEIDEK